ncbi:exodeoxyribonuclease VII large subunit [bacterium]|nr:exodeoxyribonuclease VII large subunit [bacterium]
MPPTPVSRGAPSGAPPSIPRGIGVRAFVDRIRLALDENFPARLWVEGELAEWNVHRGSGHAYLALKEGDARVEAVIWSSRRTALRFEPAVGAQVLVLVSKVDFFPPQGRLRVHVDRMEPLGQGADHLAREELRRRLQAEGLFAEERKRQLPMLPRAVGIATARPSAALQDLLKTLDARFAARRVLLRPCLVQGVDAAADVAAAIDDLNRDGSVDVIVVARGGGSSSDLRAFDDESVVRAIARSRIPVVSAVGHESDVSLADLVADLRVATPTAAANAVMPQRAKLDEAIAGLAVRLRNAATGRIRLARREAETAEARLGDPRARLRDARGEIDRLVAHARDVVSGRVRGLATSVLALEARLDATRPQVPVLRASVDALGARLDPALRARLAAARADLRREGGRLEALSPLAVLSRGFAVARRGDGTVVRTAASIAPGDELRLLFAEGGARASVLDVDTSPGPGGKALSVAEGAGPTAGPEPGRGGES